MRQRLLLSSLALIGVLAPAAVAGADGLAGDQAQTYGPVAGPAVAPIEDTYVPEGIPQPLVEAVAVAAREHPLVDRALANRRARAAQVRGAKWQRYPSLSVEGLAVTAGNQLGTQDGLAANIVLEQPLYTFGRIDSTIDAADAALETSTYGVLDTQFELALRTIGAYYDLALATEREAVMQESLTQHQELLQTIRNRVVQEVSPQADLELAASRVAQLEQDLAAVAGSRSTSYSRLQELVGYADINFGTVPQFNPGIEPPSEQELVDSALDCSPLLKGLRSTARERDAQRKAARARIFPQIVAQASTNEIVGPRIGFALRLQTGNGLSQFAAVDAARADAIAAEFEGVAAEREIREAIRVDYLTFVAARNRASASLRATKSSELVTESYKRQFIAGRRTWLDVMNALREALSANLTESEAELGALAAYTRLMVRSCNWQTPALVIPEE